MRLIKTINVIELKNSKGKLKRIWRHWVKITYSVLIKKVYMYCILDANFMIKCLQSELTLLKPWIKPTTAKKVNDVLKMHGKPGFSRLHFDLDLPGGERWYARLTSKQLIQFFHKLCFEKLLEHQYIYSINANGQLLNSKMSMQRQC